MSCRIFFHDKFESMKGIIVYNHVKKLLLNFTVSVYVSDFKNSIFVIHFEQILRYLGVTALLCEDIDKSRHSQI